MDGAATLNLDITDALVSGGYIPQTDDEVVILYDKDSLKLLSIQLEYRPAKANAMSEKDNTVAEKESDTAKKDNTVAEKESDTAKKDNTAVEKDSDTAEKGNAAAEKKTDETDEA